MIVNLSAKNDGFIVRNCQMGRNRATAFKCKATNGVVRNTRFHDQRIDLKCGINWREGTYPQNIEFSDVIIDHGTEVFVSFPGDRRVRGKEIEKHMRRIHFINTYDANGNPIQGPDGLK